MCFDYNLRNEEMTASRVCGISVPTGRENGPRRLYLLLDLLRSCLVAQMVRHLPAMWETWVQSLGWEDPLEKEMATSCLGNPMDGGAWQTTVHGVTKSPTYWASSLSLFHFKRTWTTFKSKHNIHDWHSCLLCVCVCVCVCSHSIMSESSATPFSPPGFSVHGTFLARILEWVATFSSKGSSWPRDRIRISVGSCIDRWFFNTEPPEKIHICMYVCLYICIHIYFRFLSVIITRF